jgi:hypothetical protein
MLSPETATELISLLSNNTDSLSTLSSRFISDFEVRDRLVALTGFSLLLADYFLDHQQQIVALWILYSQFRSIPISDHPFLPLFVTLYYGRNKSPNLCSPQIYDLLACILSTEWPENAVDVSVQTIMSRTFVILAPKHVSFAFEGHARLSSILTEKVETKSGAISQPEVLAMILADSALYTEFDPSFIRPDPPLSPIFPEELTAAFVTGSALPIPLFDEPGLRKD